MGESRWLRRMREAHAGDADRLLDELGNGDRDGAEIEPGHRANDAGAVREPVRA